MPHLLIFRPRAGRASAATVMSRVLLVASLWAFGLGRTASAQTPAQNNRVVPGKSVGAVTLGATRAQIRKLLGKPSETAARQFPRDTWLGPKAAMDKDGAQIGERTFMTIVYRSGKAAQIEFNDSRYKTKDGLSIKTPIAEFRKKRAPLKKTVLAYTEGGGGFVDYYLDSVKTGIAFEVGTQDTFSETYAPRSVRIHRAGRPVIVDPGGTPATE